jgi:hypothetical protein
MNLAYVLDWYTNKNVVLEIQDKDIFSSLKAGDKIVYETTDQT